MEDVYRWYLQPLEEKPPKKKTALPAANGNVALDEIIAVASAASNAEKFCRLWEGQWAGDFRSQSEADLALCSILSFYAANDSALIDRAFRQSGLMRDKWDAREYYRERTLDLAHSDEVFNWAAYRRGQSNGAITEEELQDAIRRTDAPATPQDAKDKSADLDAAAAKSLFSEQQLSRDNTVKKTTTKKEKLTQPQTLIKLAEEGADLWKTPDQEGYATVQIGKHKENWPIKSTQFRRWLAGRDWDVLGETANEKAIKSALEIIEHKALAGPTHEVYLRLARVGNTVFWDLANDAWECVEITAAGWRVISNPSVRFRRTGQTAPLPYPVAGGSLDGFRPLVRPDEDSWILIEGFLLDCLKGRGPYQIMVITGEQGSAKSTLASLVNQLIDPVKKAPLCSLPQKEENLGIDGENELVLAYDNVSHLSGWLSDAFCRLATGGGIKTRALYTNNEQFVVGFCRPLILNGIPDFAENHDLLSRSILVTQPTIPQTERKTEEDLMEQFDQVKPALLGSLCQLVADGLGRIDSTVLERLPRMADSAKWITACLGNTSYLEQAEQSEHDGIEAALEGSHTATMLKRWLAGRTEMDVEPNVLLRKLRDEADNSRSAKVTLPQNARTLSSRLRRGCRHARRSQSIDVRALKTNGKRIFRIHPWGQKDTSRDAKP